MGDTIAVEKCIAHGPWGHVYGREWIFMAQGSITKISISYGEAIYGIEFCSENASQKSYIPTQKSFFGSKMSNRTYTICLDYPNEYLTSICGRIGYLADYGRVVMSLCFFTNQNRYGPYGCDDMSNSIKYKPFSYDGKCGMIVGFHGNVGKYINAIGIYVIPQSLALDRKHICEEHTKKFCRISRMGMPRDAGPWGVSGGEPWDDGIFSNVKQVRVHVDKISKAIHAIQIEYAKKNGKSISCPTHGYTNGHIVEEVNLDWTNEYLSGISGFYKPDGLEGITSITFHSNMKVYGPYGQERGEGFVYFPSNASRGKVVGFHGRNNGVLSAIGVHMEYK